MEAYGDNRATMMELYQKYDLEESRGREKEKNKEREWIRNSVKLKCTQYGDKPGRFTVQRPTCTNCGQTRHPEVLDFKCNAFGEIQFNKNDQNTAKYVRVCEASNLDHLLLNIWKVDRPELLISVIGGSATLQMTEDEKKYFCGNLKKLVSLTGAWIMTSGTKTKVLKYVGEAFKDSQHNKQVPIVGVAPWASLGNKDKLINKEGNWPYVEESDEHVLDDNHTHFFLVDEVSYDVEVVSNNPSGNPSSDTNNTIHQGQTGVNETQQKHPGNIRQTSAAKRPISTAAKQGTMKHHVHTVTTFRNELKAKLINHIEEYDFGHKSAVILVIEGQLDDLKSLNEAVNQAKSTPVVIIEGYGGVADILAFAIRSIQNGDTKEKLTKQSVTKLVEDQYNKETSVEVANKKESKVAEKDTMKKNGKKNKRKDEEPKVNIPTEEKLVTERKKTLQEGGGRKRKQGVHDTFMNIDGQEKASSKGGNEQSTQVEIGFSPDKPGSNTTNGFLVNKEKMSENHVEGKDEDQNGEAKISKGKPENKEKMSANENDVGGKENGEAKGKDSVKWKPEISDESTTEPEDKSDNKDEPKGSAEDNSGPREKPKRTVDPKEKERAKSESVSLILNILKHWENIEVFKLNEKISEDFGLAVSIYSRIAKDDDVDDGPLREALIWNDIKKAKTTIIQDINSKRGLVLMAMRQENVEFIQLFIDNGLKLDGCFTKEDLQTLYEDKYNTLEPLMEHSFFNKLKSLGYNLPLDLDVIRRKGAGSYIDDPNARKGMKDSAAKQTSDGDKHGTISLEHLFVWCLMVKNQDLAKMFWKELKEPVAAALFAIGLFKAVISTRKLKRPEKLQILNNNTADFEKLAMEMMNMSYAKKKWFEILVQKLDNWNNKSCLILASNTKNIRFMSHTACQEVMDYLWWGQFELSSVPYVAWYSTFGIKAVFADTKLRESVLGFYNSPVVIFGLHVLSYLIFLGLHSYLMLVKFNPYFTIVEGVVCFWVFTLACEEIRQIYNSDTDTVRLKVKTYGSDSWNKLDVFTIALFIIGIILRIIPDARSFEAARLFLCLNLVCFYFRVLNIFLLSKHLGPKIEMMSKMVRKDLIPFMAIIMVFILAYSLASEAILYPNTELSWKLFYHIPRKAYWQVFGELFLEDIEGTSPCTNDPALYNDYIALRCPSEVGKYAAPIFLGMFMLVMVILLLNLLIAMFSHTFQRVQELTYPYWCYQRYQLIHEYYFRPALPPPFIFLAHVFKFFRYCDRKCRGPENVIHPESTFRLNFKSETKKKINVFEKAMAKECLMKLHKDPESMGRDDFRKGAVSSTTDFNDVLTKLSVIHGLVDKNEEKVADDAVFNTDKASPEDVLPTVTLPAVSHATLLQERKAIVKPVKSDQQPLKSDVSTVSTFRKRSLNGEDIGMRLESRQLDQFEKRIETRIQDMLKENRKQMEIIIENSNKMVSTGVSRPRVLSSKIRGYQASRTCHCPCASCRAAMAYALSIKRRFQQLK